MNGTLSDVVDTIAAAGFLASPVRVINRDGARAMLISTEQARLLNELVLQQATTTQRPLTTAELEDFLAQPPNAPEPEVTRPTPNPPA